ncbi:hypothetical protein [Dechloromonas denitrificans]|uniref:hypothetical protein n=1 Tax=Dechloromonas denitrificans TaxID=281362 RepID=UPI001CF8592C|nr:hypothetical protein [Dechloromonas denitrificans]UCV02341.1 hypothetical protein KI611_14745 [Dechloromonas denitrificans]
MTTEKPACDCLNWCGDDPWLRDGRAEPCAEAKKREADRQEILAIKDRVKALAASAQDKGLVVIDAELMASIHITMDRLR